MKRNVWSNILQHSNTDWKLVPKVAQYPNSDMTDCTMGKCTRDGRPTICSNWQLFYYLEQEGKTKKKLKNWRLKDFINFLLPIPPRPPRPTIPPKPPRP